MKPGRSRNPRRVVALVGASVAVAALLELVGLAAGLLLGPMIVGIAFAATDRPVIVPEPAFHAAQALVGCLIASSFDPSILGTVTAHPVILFGSAFATLAASGLLGYVLSRWQVLPGSSAVLGSMPGAATAMTLMARSYGADARLVAVMAYLRVICVAGTASVLAAFVAGPSAAGAPGEGWFPPLEPGPIGTTFAVAFGGALIATRLRVPAAALMGPLVIGTVLELAGLIELALPGWLLAAGYAIIGWRIGLGFTPETLDIARRALPRLLLAIGALMTFCGMLAWSISRATGIDLVTAWLATSPGGMDSVAIIATTTPVDVPFVMAMQALRFVTVLSLAPTLARAIAKRVAANVAASGSGPERDRGHDR